MTMTLEQLTNGMRKRVATRSGLDGTVKYDFGADGVIFVDNSTTPFSVSNESREADCVISVSLADYAAIVRGELDDNLAFVMGRLRVTGNTAIAMSLPSVLGSMGGTQEGANGLALPSAEIFKAASSEPR